MSDSIKFAWGGGMLGTPGRCSFAGACLSLVLTVTSFAGICAVIVGGIPDFFPASWSYGWVAEMFFLWCIPFFLVVWRLTAAVLEEKFGNGDTSTDAGERSESGPQSATMARTYEDGDSR